jgi:hypothetical protein
MTQITRYIQSEGKFTNEIWFCEKHVMRMRNGRRKLIKIKRVLDLTGAQTIRKRDKEDHINYFLKEKK